MTKRKRTYIKYPIVLIITLLLCVETNAQELKYGIIAGLNLVSMSLSNATGDGFYYDSSPNITYNVNGFIELRSDSWWGISLEPGFIRKGGLLDLTYSKGTTKFFSQNNRSYSNIDLPVLLNIDLNQKFYLSAGIEMDYTVSSSINNQYRSNAVNYKPAGSTNTQSGTSASPDIVLLPNLNNKLSCSAILGVSYKLNDRYDICLRYGLGMTKLTTVNLIDNIKNSSYCNYLQLALKYSIN